MSQRDPPNARLDCELIRPSFTHPQYHLKTGFFLQRRSASFTAMGNERLIDYHSLQTIPIQFSYMALGSIMKHGVKDPKLAAEQTLAVSEWERLKYVIRGLV